MQRISVTTIEKFRRYMTEASSYDTEEALIESIQGLFPGNEKTKVGAAYHKIMQGAFTTDGESYLADDIIFTKQQAIPALKYHLEHPVNIHEIPIRKVYETIHGPLQVTGRIDEAEGQRIRDGKCKFRSIDIRDYEASSQWKFYLDITEADTFIFDLFEVKYFDGLSGKPPHKLNPKVMFIAHEPFTCIRYEVMEQEIQSLLNDFMDYINNRNFFSLLKPALADEFSLF